MNKLLMFLLLIFLITHTSLAQNKAYVLQNSWINTLSPYNPGPFFNNIFSLLQKQLNVKEIERNPLVLTTATGNEDYKEMIGNHAKENNGTYYISLASNLSFPLINLSRIIFKKPTRSSRFVFTVNIYNNKAEKILSDTIVNKGCVVKLVSDDKIKDFYADYSVFKQDMQCHFEAIRKQLEK